MTRVKNAFELSRRGERILKLTLTFLEGGVSYGLVELLWRGYTHPSMVAAGGICLVFIKEISLKLRRAPVLLKAVACASAVTLVELISGCVLNLGLGLSVWDYSGMALNYKGQICLFYSILWFFMCLPIVILMQKSEKTRLSTKKAGK